MMIWSMDRRNLLRRFAGQVALLGAGCMLATLLAVPLAVAQQQQQPATPKAKATQQPKGQAKPPAAQGNQSEAAWVKLCEKSKETESKEICLTHHERLDGNSGMVLVAAAIRRVAGDDKEQFLVRLPTAIALAIPAGVQVRIDENDPISLTYTLCYATSCQAEIPLTPELLKSLRKGKQMVVAAINLQRKAIGFPVPLTGFNKAYDGPPVDNAKYQQARRQLMETIRKRQMELANKAAEAQQKKQQQGGQPQAGAQAPAKGAPNATAQPKKPATPPAQ